MNYLYRMIGKRFLLLLLLAGLLASCSMNPQRLNLAELEFARQHYQLAFKRLQMPARAGDMNAQYALGYLYFYGKGVFEDKALAKYWFSLAAAQGHLDAQNALDSIAKHERHYRWPHSNLEETRKPRELRLRQP